MGGKQRGFTDYELTTAKKRTKREKFSAEMEVVVPWEALLDLIEPPRRFAMNRLRWWLVSGAGIPWALRIGARVSSTHPTGQRACR